MTQAINTMNKELIAKIKSLSNLENCWSAEDMQDSLQKIHDLLQENYPDKIEMSRKPYVVEFAGVNSKGGFVRLFSEQQHKQDDYFKIIIHGVTYHYQLKNISVVEGGYEMELKETGYWSTTTTKHGVDLNDIMHQTVIPVTDEEESKEIYQRSCWC